MKNLQRRRRQSLCLPILCLSSCTSSVQSFTTSPSSIQPTVTTTAIRLKNDIIGGCSSSSSNSNICTDGGFSRRRINTRPTTAIFIGTNGDRKHQHAFELFCASSSPSSPSSSTALSSSPPLLFGLQSTFTSTSQLTSGPSPISNLDKSVLRLGSSSSTALHALPLPAEPSPSKKKNNTNKNNANGRRMQKGRSSTAASASASDSSPAAAAAKLSSPRSPAGAAAASKSRRMTNKTKKTSTTALQAVNGSRSTTASTTVTAVTALKTPTQTATKNKNTSGQNGTNGTKRDSKTGATATATATSTTKSSSPKKTQSASPQPPIPYKGITHNTRAKRSRNRTTAGAWYQRDEMMQHEILTKEAEVSLGQKIKRAKKLRDEMTALIEKYDLNNVELGSGTDDAISGVSGATTTPTTTEEYIDHDDIGSSFDWLENSNSNKMNALNDDDDDDDMAQMGIPMINMMEGMGGGATSTTSSSMTTYEMEQYMSIHNKNMNGFGQPQSRFAPYSTRQQPKDSRFSSTLVQDGSKLSATYIEHDLEILSNEDIVTVIKLKGGKKELREILQDGSDARDMLMRSNIRLVISVSKKWMGNSYSDSNGGGIADRYNGSWDRPSLDEVIQEGVLGLARAVDKYDPDRGLRFSTYSTHWITSYVRQCFQVAATGCLKVPSQLHDIKSSYKTIIKRHFDSSEPIPSEEQIATEIGVTTSRLRTAIRVTESILSIDEPVFSGGSAAYKGSGAGGDLSGENNLLISDRLECSEIAPEDYVENSFLRQTLENAMAAELSPYERDILRLRLGLDDGQPRTVRQVVEECGGGITISDVRSAERRAFKKLRSPNAVHAHNLAAYLEMADIDFETFETFHERRW